jgi:hypothetical protein
MNLINDTLNIIFRYSHNKNCILVCKLWYDIILQNSIKCKYCNKFTKIYDDDVKIIDDKICHSPYDTIVRLPISSFKYLLSKIIRNIGMNVDVQISCSKDKLIIIGKINHTCIESDYSISNNIKHKNKIDNKFPEIISGTYPLKTIYSQIKDVTKCVVKLRMKNNGPLNIYYVDEYEEMEIELHNKN